MTFADILKTELRKKGISQGELSQKTGIADSTISRYMTKGKQPSMRSLQKIASVLNVSCGSLLQIADAERKATLKDTTLLMTSPDYKDRFLAEYLQTKIRYERLKLMCDKYEAAKLNGETQNNFLGFTPKCSLELLREQQKHMGNYLHTLEVRAIIEGVELNL